MLYLISSVRHMAYPHKNNENYRGITMNYLSALRIMLVLLTFSALPLQAAGDYSQPQELVDQSEIVVKRFSTDQYTANFRETVKEARAVFIIPKMLKGGFVIGGSGGSGVLLNRDLVTSVWSYPAFYTMGSVSIGFQAGAEASEMILLVMTEKGMDSLLTSSFKLGADVSVAAGPVGTGVKAATADILAYSITKGVYGGASVEGAVIKTREEWNRDFYGASVSPADIIIRKKATNPQADTLRATLQAIAGGKLTEEK